MTRKPDIYEKLTLGSARLVVRHPLPIVVIFLLLAMASLIPISGMDTSTKMSDYTPTSRFTDADVTLRSQFNSTSIMICTLEARDGNIMDRDGLIMLRSIESSITKDPSVSGYLITYGDPVMTIADPVANAVSLLSNGTQTLESCPDGLLQSAIGMVLTDRNASALVSMDDSGPGAYALLLINMRYNLIERDDERVELAMIDDIKGCLDDGYRFTTFGGLNHEMEQDSLGVIFTLVPIALALVLVILLVALRNITDMLIAFSGIIVSLLISFGIYSVTGAPFSQMTYFAPLMIIVLSIDYALHLMLRYNEYKRGGLSPKKAMTNAIRFMGISILLSTLTTSIAFSSNGFSNIPAVAAFGLFLGLGIGISFLVMLFFVPSMKLLSIRLLKGLTPRRGRLRRNRALERAGKGAIGGIRHVGAFSIRFNVPVILVALLLFGGGMYLSSMLTKDVSPKDTMSPNSSVVRTLHIMDREFPSIGAEQVHIIVKGDVADPAFLLALNRSIDNMYDDAHVGQQNGVPKALSILPYVKMIVRYDPRINDSDLDGIPDTRKDTLTVLDRLYYQGIPDAVDPELIRSLLSSGDGPAGVRSFDMTLILVEAKNVGGNNGEYLYKELRDDVVPFDGVDGTGVEYAGFVFERFDLMNAMTDGMVLSTGVSIALCATIVVILFGSLRYGIVSTIPVILVTGWILGIMYLMGFSLNVVTATITAMTIGIGIDYSIHLVERYHYEKRKGLGIDEAMLRSMETTGLSLVAAGTTTFSGFFVMFFSDIGMFKTFGILSSIMIVLSTLVSLTVLPGLLVLSERLAGRLIRHWPGMPPALRWILSVDVRGKDEADATGSEGEWYQA